MYNNRQAIINVVAMYFVLSMALHQVQVKVSRAVCCHIEEHSDILTVRQKAWEQLEHEYEETKAIAEKVEADLTQEQWVKVMKS